MKKRLTIVNRHYPPNINITGENAWDLAKYLITKHNIDVDVVHIDRSYEGGGNKREPIGTTHKIRTIYKGKNKLLGYLSGFFDGVMLIKTAKELKKGPIIVMTSPPLLPMWASLFLGKKGIKWILWSMDLFPEGFTSSDQISNTNFIYKYILKLTYKFPPNQLIALGPQQKNVLERKYHKSIEGTILPCGVFVDQDMSNDIPNWKTHSNKIYFGYAGNCGSPHSPEFIIHAIDAINPDTQHMVLAVYGIYAEQIKRHAKNKEGVTLLPSIPRNELHHIDVHLVTLIEKWTHVAVPSKAVSSICSGSTILFCGNIESDNWHMFQNAGWFVPDSKNLKLDVENVMKNITMEEIIVKKEEAKKIGQELNSTIIQSYDTIATWAR